MMGFEGWRGRPQFGLRVLIAVLISLTLWGAPAMASSYIASPDEDNSSMIVEWLKFRMDPAQRQHYVDTDSAIWTPALAQYPGFVDKATFPFLYTKLVQDMADQNSPTIGPLCSKSFLFPGKRNRSEPSGLQSIHKRSLRPLIRPYLHRDGD